jgi:hypothetical protein
VICENALLAAYAGHRKPVDRPLVAQVCRDLDLSVGSPGEEDAATQGDDTEPEVRHEPVRAGVVRLLGSSRM